LECFHKASTCLKTHRHHVQGDCVPLLPASADAHMLHPVAKSVLGKLVWIWENLIRFGQNLGTFEYR